MKHCNSKKSTFTNLKSQNFMESAPGLAIDARILECLEFFEHYSVL